MRFDALWRIRPYVRPYARQMWTIIVQTLFAVTLALIIPLVTKSIIDGPLRTGNRGALISLVILATALGLFEAGLAFLRRFWLSRLANGMEKDMRDDLYAHLQRLHVAFHDEWQSGQ